MFQTILNQEVESPPAQGGIYFLSKKIVSMRLQRMRLQRDSTPQPLCFQMDTQMVEWLNG